MNKELDLLNESLARLSIIRDGWEHKSKWNQKLGTTFLDLYIENYKNRINILLNNNEK